MTRNDQHCIETQETHDGKKTATTTTTNYQQKMTFGSTTIFPLLTY